MIKKFLFFLMVCVFAQEYCEITRSSSFPACGRSDLKLYSFGSFFIESDKSNYESNLASSFTTETVSRYKPNSKILNKFYVHSEKTGESYHLTETIQLQGCDIESVVVDSGVIESTVDFTPNRSNVEYRFLYKNKT